MPIVETVAATSSGSLSASGTDPLVVRNVVKTFAQGAKRVTALGGAPGGVSLNIKRGTFLAVMGASGSGKSTLLHLMAGLAQADSGEVLIAGTNLTRLNDKDLTLFRRRHIGIVFQAFNLIPTLSAEENVLLPLLLEGKETTALRERARSLLEKLNLGSRMHHRPDAMSGGEQQRVAIARALVAKPEVILADEPTGNLDSANSRGVCELLRDLSANEGKTIAMVTHEPSVAAYASEVAILRDGQLVERFETHKMDPLELAGRYHQVVSRTQAAQNQADTDGHSAG